MYIQNILFNFSSTFQPTVLAVSLLATSEALDLGRWIVTRQLPINVQHILCGVLFF